MKIYATAALLMIAVSAFSQSVKVMSYNIRYDTEKDSVNRWSNRKDKVAALIQKYDPDLIGLQEALHHQVMDLLKSLPAYAYIGAGRDDGKEKGEYSAILYRKDRFQMNSQKTSWLSETPDVPGSKNWDAAITRVVTSGEFVDKKTKKRFVYFNTHFDHIGKEARKHSAEIIVKMVAKEKQPVLVTGDFNSQITEDPYKIMAASLKDSRPETNTEGTFCNFKVNSQPCNLIDYIFSNKPSVDYKVINDNDGTYYPSDHLPVLAEFNLSSD